MLLKLNFLIGKIKHSVLSYGVVVIGRAHYGTAFDIAASMVKLI